MPNKSVKNHATVFDDKTNLSVFKGTDKQCNEYVQKQIKKCGRKENEYTIVIE